MSYHPILRAGRRNEYVTQTPDMNDTRRISVLDKSLYLVDPSRSSDNNIVTKITSLPGNILSQEMTGNKFPTDPKIFGPGTWFNMHIVALDADTPEKIQHFIIYIRMIVTKLPCRGCSSHAIKYVETNSPEQFVNLTDKTGKNIGMFKWSWMFHNDVNNRLGKPIINWDTAYSMYKDDEMAICPIGCGD